MYKYIISMIFVLLPLVPCSADNFHERTWNWGTESPSFLNGSLRFNSVEDTTEYIISFPVQAILNDARVMSMEKMPFHGHTDMMLDAYLVSVVMDGDTYQAELYYYLFDSHEDAEWWIVNEHAHPNRLTLLHYPDEEGFPDTIGDTCFYGIRGNFIFFVRNNVVIEIGAIITLMDDYYQSGVKTWNADANIILAQSVDTALQNSSMTHNKTELPTPRVKNSSINYAGLNATLVVEDPKRNPCECFHFFGTSHAVSNDFTVSIYDDPERHPKKIWVINNDNYITSFDYF